jgi:hypothetical protein
MPISDTPIAAVRSVTQVRCWGCQNGGILSRRRGRDGVRPSGAEGAGAPGRPDRENTVLYSAFVSTVSPLLASAQPH